jgi:hypothetical protein
MRVSATLGERGRQVVPTGGQARIAHLLLLVSLIANPRPTYAAANRFTMTTMLAYVIAALAS